MALVIRLSRGGAKKRPYYRMVVADSRFPRDGRYIEKVGSYNPMLPKDSAERVTLEAERIQHWLGQGAKASDRVTRLLAQNGIGEHTNSNNPNKAKPGKKALERIEEKKQKEEAKKEAEAEAKEAAAAAAAAPVEEAPAEEAPAEEVVADAAPAEEAAADAGEEKKDA